MYISTCLSDAETSSVLNDLHKIRVFNSNNRITGALLHLEQVEKAFFVQFIEGDPEEINALYERIAKDPRHTNINIIYTASNGIRFFDQWAMGFISSQHNQSDQQHLTEGMVDEILESIDKGSPQGVITLIQSMYEISLD